MPTRPFYWILSLIILLAFTVSCTEQTPPPLPAVTATDSPSTPVPAPLPSVTPSVKQKPPRGAKIPGGATPAAGQPVQSMPFDVPSVPLNVILGRPTSNSITLSLLSATDQAVTISYGAENATPDTQTVALKANIPAEAQLSNLTPDTLYLYTLNGGEKRPFHTARAPGSTFTFTIQADSHLDSNTSAEAYSQTLANQRADQPDFFIDLGDTFMTEKYKPYTDAAPQYLAQRYFLGQLAGTAPLFLVLGNHDGEGAPRGNSGMEISLWSAQMRTSLFPNPMPDMFYTGNSTPIDSLGSLQNYYAWEWGDALFIVLDPYWFTPPTRGNTTNLWNPTLGTEQYQWLQSTLETSNAQWKFIFIHQLIGGADKDGRGGVEVAHLYEWGGYELDGAYTFDQNRPGWDRPIHQLLLANRVTAVFHGHDHLFVYQELDGIVYQEVPQPANARPGDTNSAAQYGYVTGDILGGPGHLRVTVSPDVVTVDYVQSEDGQVGYSYIIRPEN